jgi:hypothetical protein
MESNILELQETIEGKIKYIEEQTRLINNREITPQGLNHALANYNIVNNFLINQYEIVCLEDEELKDGWKLVWSDWFITAKNKLNDSRTSSKFASATEVEAHALIDNREEYLKWKKKLNISERRVSMYRRFMESWKTQANILVNLCQNMRSELSALSVENRANKDLTKEKIIRKVKVVRDVVEHEDVESEDF